MDLRSSRRSRRDRARGRGRAGAFALALLAALLPGAGGLAATAPQDTLTLADSADALDRRAQALFRSGARADALDLLTREVALLRQLGNRQGEVDALNKIAEIHVVEDRPDSVLTYLHRARNIHREDGNRLGEGSALNNLGLAFEQFGPPDSALAYFRLALDATREVGEVEGEGLMHYNVAGAQRDLGRLDSALVHYQSSLAIARQLGDRAGVGVTLNEMGVVHHLLGRPDSALAYYELALGVNRDVENLREEANSLGNIGMVHARAERGDSALAYFALALATHRELGDRSGEAAMLNEIGEVHRQADRPDSALVYYRLALEADRAAGNAGGEGVTLNNIGMTFDALDRPDSALAYFDRALALVREVGDRAAEGKILGNVGHIYHRRLPVPDLAAAAAYYDSAAAVMASVSRSAPTDATRLVFDEQYVNMFGEWALAWLGRASTSGAREASLAALAAAEQGRSQALLDLMGDADERAAGQDLVEEGARLAAPLVEAHVHGISYMITPDTLLAWLIEPSGEVTVFRQPVPRDTIWGLILETRRSLGADGRAGVARLVRHPEGFLEELDRSEIVGRRPAGGWPGASGAALAELMLPEELTARIPASSEVVVVPDGPLGIIPVAALQQAEDDAPAGARYAIRYVPSLATFAAVAARDPADTDVRAGPLVVGNPTMPAAPGDSRGELLRSLPGAEKESRWVASLLGTEPTIGATATERAVRDRIPGASLIHLATHGFAYSSESRARDSFVALGPGEGYDGLLTVGEVMDDPALAMRAELVVLSACQTGLGDVREGEGTVGLQRAFLARGARSMLVSLWNVSDEATELLMRAFYGHWLEDEDGPTRAEALRRAQEDVRATPGFEHPRFWAAFQLVGAG